MKKILSITMAILLIAVSLFAFASCGKKTDEAIKVTTLNGTTGFGMAPLMKEHSLGNTKNEYEFSVQSDASVVTAGLMNGSIDIAALPTNAAANVYNKTEGGVQIIAINTLGVLYVVTNGVEISSVADLEGKTIYCPAQNPLFITKYILEKNGLNGKVTVDSTTYAKPDALRDAVKTGSVEIAVLPEPMVTIAKSGNQNVKVALDLTAEWNKISDGKQLVQGCVVVRTEFANEYPGSVDSFLKEYKASIEALNEDTTSAASAIKEFGIFANEAVAKNAIPKCNIAYMDGDDMKDAMENFLDAMYAIAPASIGNAIPSDDFYYGA
ncbi:MAG: ABC transporter substrate-binding protein [Clostridia bacterium]|nr:ABC transporter substrate-binding protein [Clostridia bacterium]MBR2296301.1 ABC transporter substrate-binding protein [Clostridia bacterium]